MNEFLNLMKRVYILYFVISVANDFLMMHINITSNSNVHVYMS